MPKAPRGSNGKIAFRVRRILFGGVELLGAEAGNADHADIAIAPWLLRNPFDQVVAVPLAASAAVGFENSARRTDDVNIAARDEEFGVARLQEPGPQRGPSGLRGQRGGDLRPLQVLVVDREREQRGKFLGRIRTIDVDRKIDAVAHRHGDVFLGDHPLMTWACDHRPPELRSPAASNVVCVFSVMSDSTPIRSYGTTIFFGSSWRPVQVAVLSRRSRKKVRSSGRALLLKVGKLGEL